MAKYILKRTIFLTPLKKVEGNKSLAPLPNRAVLKKGDVFEGTLKPSNTPNVNNLLSFEYGGYVFEKPYGGSDVYARMNALDMVRFMPEGALVGTPLGNSNVQGSQYTRPMEGQELGQNNQIYSEGKPNTSIAIGEPNPNIPTTKSTTGLGIFQFKSKLHAGVTLVGVALGVYYAYKTKASIGKYIGYSLGAGAVGFILGGVASSFALQTPVKQLKEDSNRETPEGAKPGFTGTISPNINRKGGKLDTSVEGGTMTSQMNSIL